MKAKKIILEQDLQPSENEIAHNFYDTDILDEFVDNDLISGAEDGFMQGYLDA